MVGYAGFQQVTGVYPQKHPVVMDVMVISTTGDPRSQEDSAPIMLFHVDFPGILISIYFNMLFQVYLFPCLYPFKKNSHLNPFMSYYDSIYYP